MALSDEDLAAIDARIAAREQGRPQTLRIVAGDEPARGRRKQRQEYSDDEYDALPAHLQRRYVEELVDERLAAIDRDADNQERDRQITELRNQLKKAGERPPTIWQQVTGWLWGSPEPDKK